jgi:hypothetical protein
LPQAEKREVYVCLTVDGDAGQNPHAIGKGFPLLLKIYDRFNLQGTVSWFINNQDEWTTRYPHFLEAILKRGDRIELHCHVEDLIRDDDYHKILSQLKKGKEELEQFCRSIIPDYQVECFRSGRFDRSEKMFTALEEIGIRYDSSLTHSSSFKINGRKIDDTDISPSTNCYFLKPISYKVPQKNQTQIVEIPVWEPFPRLKKLLRAGHDPVVITNLIHPFNLITARGAINHFVKGYYQWIVRLHKKIHSARFLTLVEAGERWKTVQDRKRG